MMKANTIVIDYGAGNLRSVEKALNYINADFKISSDPCDVLLSDAVILPGVGAFPEAMKKLDEYGLTDALKKHVLINKRPLFVICLGMQMLFEKGYEFKETDGLGFISGTVEKMQFSGLKIPHMGWNSLTFTKESPFEKDTTKNPFCYFVHSYKAITDDENIIAYTEYGTKVPALVGNGIVFGAQYHPEKSGDVGLKMLKNFYDWINTEL